MADTTEKNKPDFRSGFLVGELRDGSMISGQADGEEVVLARRGDEFFAVGGHWRRRAGVDQLSGGLQLRPGVRPVRRGDCRRCAG